MRTYGQIVDDVKKVSGPQLVALFCVIAGECIKKKCFNPGGMKTTIARIENRIAEEMGKEEPKPKIAELTCGSCGATYTLDTNYIHRTCGLRGCKGKLHKL